MAPRARVQLLHLRVLGSILSLVPKHHRKQPSSTPGETSEIKTKTLGITEKNVKYMTEVGRAVKKVEELFAAPRA